jgi:aryl-alcohol dehydrogenase-like predicted oxidoreductase
VALATVAAVRGATRAQVALAWLLAQPDVTVPIIGASTPAHFDDAAAALALELGADDVAQLEAHYQPHPVVGFEWSIADVFG